MKKICKCTRFVVNLHAHKYNCCLHMRHRFHILLVWLLSLSVCLFAENAFDANYTVSMRELLSSLNRQCPNVQGIVVMKDGRIALEAMRAPYDAQVPRILHSVSKSFTSMAVGLCITDGTLSLDDQLISYVGDKLPDNYDRRIEQLTIRDMLRFTAGQASFSSAFIGVNDWVEKYLSMPLPAEPGTKFTYDGGGSHTLCYVVQQVSGKSAYQLVRERIFNPLGIEQSAWITSPQGVTAGGWGLYLSLHDLAKIGQLWLQQGNWNGQQLISRQYMQQATIIQTPFPNPSGCHIGYGYQFWIGSNWFEANGAFGQLVLVCPKANAVAVILADNPTGEEGNRCRDLVRRYAFADKPAQTNYSKAKAKHDLDAAIQQFERYTTVGKACNKKVESQLFDRQLSIKCEHREPMNLYLHRENATCVKMVYSYIDRAVDARATYGTFAINQTAQIAIPYAFPQELRLHTTHCMTYDFLSDTLRIFDYWQQSNNHDTYKFWLEADSINCSVKISNMILK